MKKLLLLILLLLPFLTFTQDIDLELFGCTDEEACNFNEFAKLTTISGAKSYLIQKIQTSQPAWVTVYTDTASSTADANRLETVNPTPGSGIIAEVITSSGNLTQRITPGVLGFNDDGTPSGNIYLKVANKSGSQQSDIVVTVTYVQLEG